MPTKTLKGAVPGYEMEEMPRKGRYRLLERHAMMKVTVRATRAAYKTNYGSMLRCVSITLITTRISLLMRTRST
jgi:hypothetical protein